MSLMCHVEPLAWGLCPDLQFFSLWFCEWFWLCRLRVLAHAWPLLGVFTPSSRSICLLVWAVSSVCGYERAVSWAVMQMSLRLGWA